MQLHVIQVISVAFPFCAHYTSRFVVFIRCLISFSRAVARSLPPSLPCAPSPSFALFQRIALYGFGDEELLPTPEEQEVMNHTRVLFALFLNSWYAMFCASRVRGTAV